MQTLQVQKTLSPLKDSLYFARNPELKTIGPRFCQQNLASCVMISACRMDSGHHAPPQIKLGSAVPHTGEVEDRQAELVLEKV